MRVLAGQIKQSTRQLHERAQGLLFEGRGVFNISDTDLKASEEKWKWREWKEEKETTVDDNENRCICVVGFFTVDDYSLDFSGI